MEQNHLFPEVRGNFGFGCMRLPMNGEGVGKAEFCRMIDAFITTGFNYFSTTHDYTKSKSKTAITACVSSCYPRERLLLTNKLTESHFEEQEDIRPFLMQQLALYKVDYFDFYLIHAQNKENYQKFKRCRAYEMAGELKQEGCIRHLDLSLHDKVEALDMILGEYPEIEFVQIQFNYLDYKSDEVEERKVYGVCEKYQKPVMIIEPVKGGSLMKLPEEVSRILRGLNGDSNANYTIHFAASFPQIAVVLSSMNNLEQMKDDSATMYDFGPLTEAETEALHKVYTVFGCLDLIPCTACHYCVEESACPKNIRIPEILGVSSTYESFHSPNMIDDYRNFMTTGDHDKAADYIRYDRCEKVCPQHLKIRELLAGVAAISDRQWLRSRCKL